MGNDDLERKFETALANRLKQHTPLKGVRIRRNSEDSAKVNQDIVISAKRGTQSPPFSGVFDMEATVTLSMRYRKTVDTLTIFLGLLKAIEEVLTISGNETTTFGVERSILAAQLSLATPDFHCYEIAVSGKDDTPEDKKHSCVWSLTAVAMPFSYAIASQLQSNT